LHGNYWKLGDEKPIMIKKLIRGIWEQDKATKTDREKYLDNSFFKTKYEGANY